MTLRLRPSHRTSIGKPAPHFRGMQRTSATFEIDDFQYADAKPHEFTREPCRVISMTVPRNEREQREELARLHTIEEARAAREMRESEAFNDAMRRFEELQRRTVWQRIKALFGGGR